MIQHLYTTISIGIEKPFSLIHISDPHLTLADDRDDRRKLVLATERAKYFPLAEETLDYAHKLSEKNGMPIVVTGDLIDFVSYANLDRARRFTNENDVFAAAGNHEYSLYVGEAKEDAAYRAQSLDRVQASFTNDIRFSTRCINGVKMVALDNGYYQIEPWQLERLKTEIAEGLPIILLFHTPLYVPEYFEFSSYNRTQPGYLLNVPPELMDYYPPERIEQQKADETTREAYELIKSCPQIKLILAGHEHRDYEMSFFDKPQIVTGVGTVREVLLR